MPSHNADLNDPKNILRILMAVVIKSGNELRVKAPLYDSMDRGKLLVVDFDAKKNEIVLRATSDFGRAVVVQPESFQWSQPPNVAPLERARAVAEAESAKSAVHSDEELADMEEAAERRQALAREAAKSGVAMRIKTVK